MTDKGKGFKTHYTRGQRLEAEGKNIFPSNLKWAKRALLKSTFMSFPRKRESVRLEAGAI